jgi:hypothetical protein
LSTLDLEIFETTWRIVCADSAALDVLRANFGELIARAAREPRHTLLVEPADGGGWTLAAPHAEARTLTDTYELVYFVEKALQIGAQHVRADLFFLHAAALEFEGRAFLLVAASGSGKSTTAWALANRGFGYLSDELAPIARDALTVAPYPHALCLKSRPPAPFTLPPNTLVTSRTMHVPPGDALRVVRTPTRLAAIFFNRYDAGVVPAARAISAGEAAALLYSHALNPLAHEKSGLASVARIAEAVPSFALSTNDLEATCAVVRATLTGILRE